MKHKKTVFLCFLLVLFIEGAVFLLSMSPPAIVRSMTIGDPPKEFLEQRQYFSDLSDYAVCSDHVYVLFGDIGVLELYTLNGEYVKSFAFGIQKTGKPGLYVNASGVWLEDQGHTLFQFVNGNYVDKSSEKEYWSLHHSFYSQKQARTSEDGSQYHLKWASIYKSEEVIITRPWYCILVQGVIPLIIHATFLITFACFVVFPYHKGNTDNTENRPPA